MEANPVSYSFDERGRFVVENYNWAKAFSNFLPGIAGEWGVPSWCFYVNRGQGISSLGVKDKDGAILEFLSFNKACQYVGLQGFRTFLRIDGGAVYEPFRKVDNFAVRQRMRIASFELSLEEQHAELDLDVRVDYFPLVNQRVAGLVRQVSLTNAGKIERDIQLVDGAPRVLPHGVTFEHLHVIARHIEGMMGAFEFRGIPIFRLKQTSADVEQVGEIEGANFYFGMSEGSLLGKYLNDPAVVFGVMDDFTFPWPFATQKVEELLQTYQVRENRTPCAFSALHRSLPAGESLTLLSVLGRAPDEDGLGLFIDSLAGGELVERMRTENQAQIEQIENMAFTASAEPLFDRYSQQTFLDNVLRGGMPSFFKTEDRQSVFYIYQRQGGDPERDYHWFTLEPTYLSQGNGHYRNVCQNRRMDPWFFPDVGEHNIRLFMNLIQTDGYNPLVINGKRFVADNIEQVRNYLNSLSEDLLVVDHLAAFVSRPFSPGEFIMLLEQHTGHKQEHFAEILGGLLPLCRTMEIGDLHAGFWVDHWLYNMDMIDSYLAIYPERLAELVFGDHNYTFFDDPDVVQPRSRKIVLVGDDVRQYDAVLRDVEKEALIEARMIDRHKVRTRDGRVYRTSLFIKLLCVVTNKLAALDPAGLGIEMEAGKPGWLDSLNGLPGMLGSSLCQTAELLRALRFMLDALEQAGMEDDDEIPVYAELLTFMGELKAAIEARSHDPSDEAGFMFWDQSHIALETYRERTRLGLDGQEGLLSVVDIKDFLQAGIGLLQVAFSDAQRDVIFDPRGVPYTYFINEVEEYSPIHSTETAPDGRIAVRPTSFHQKALPLFLEGPVHFLRVFPERTAEIYTYVRESEIYDSNLQMFKSCESLMGQPAELGRILAYPSGWIENESIYTHMTYKWLLEILRNGLVEPFMEDIRNTLPPFMSAERYGRSTLENCSFIASSAYPDGTAHGQAFQPRQSGVTAEWLQIWTEMVAGGSPFSLGKDDALKLCLKPVLPEWLFSREAQQRAYWDREDGWSQIEIPENCFAFRFLGSTLVLYHNPSRKPTYGADATGIVGGHVQYREGRELRVEGDCMGSQIAHDVRNGLVKRMDFDLA